MTLGIAITKVARAEHLAPGGRSYVSSLGKPRNFHSASLQLGE